jgi:hypothetical protein
VLAGLDRAHQPKPTDNRVRTREQIDRLITDKRQPLEDRTLWSMLYSTAARAEEVLSLDITDLDRATAGPARSARAANPMTCSTTSAPPACSASCSAADVPARCSCPPAAHPKAQRAPDSSTQVAAGSG